MFSKKDENRLVILSFINCTAVSAETPFHNIPVISMNRETSSMTSKAIVSGKIARKEKKSFRLFVFSSLDIILNVIETHIQLLVFA
jgi:hypothetical protein